MYDIWCRRVNLDLCFFYSGIKLSTAVLLGCFNDGVVVGVGVGVKFTDVY
jgi:hypothetical protein